LHGLPRSEDGGSRRGIERHGDATERDLPERAERDFSGSDSDPGFHHAGALFDRMPTNAASDAPLARNP
jgi:hypothetical protein